MIITGPSGAPHRFEVVECGDGSPPGSKRGTIIGPGPADKQSLQFGLAETDTPATYWRPASG